MSEKVPEKATEKSPLWPNDTRIEVIGLTGDYASGKTLFGLTIAPGKDTLVYDTEKSAGTYQSLGFDRVDLPAALLGKFKGSAYKPIDLFEFWLASVRSIEPGRYRVIMLDTVSEVENGLVDWVREHPKEFGYSASQFSMGGFLWGAVKDYWKAILADIAARCETFVFASHLRTVWKGGSPTGQKAAKGKDTLMELASLYLHMERKKDAKGNIPAVPSATVLKSRLSATAIVDGKVVIRPYLPPRLPEATPDAIRAYIVAPPDYSHLKKSELAPEEQMTEDERLQLKAATAQAEAQAEALRNERLARTQAAVAGKQAATAASTTTTTTTPAATAAAGNGNASGGSSNGNGNSNGVHTPKKDDPAHPFGDAPTEGQLTELRALKTALAVSDENWIKILEKRGCKRAIELGQQQITELIATMREKIEAKRKEANGKQAPATPATPATPAAAATAATAAGK